MSVSATIRHIGVSVVGVASAVALIAGCTSSRNGTPLNVPSSVAGSSAPATSSAAPTSGSGGTTLSVPSSLPVSIPAVSSVPALGGSKFCKDFSSQGNLGDIGATGDVGKVIGVWDKLAAEAPAAIKDDVKTIADYLHALAGGKVDPAAAQKLSTAAQHIGTYIATNCR